MSHMHISNEFQTSVRVPWTVQGDTVVVAGDLVLDNAEQLSNAPNLDLLPRSLVVQGGLFIASQKPFRLPERLVVESTMVLHGRGMSQLAPELSVGSDISLEHTRIARLPNGLHVQGNLTLHLTPITFLPMGLRVDGDLKLLGTDIARFPENMIVAGRIMLPPASLQDLVAFMRARSDRTFLVSDPSAHERMQLRSDMRAFPDLLRIIESRTSWERLMIHQGTDGYRMIFR
ncbi:MAG: hypothetical protein ACRYGG_09615 [Janthinobacterium lividum]